MKLPFYYIHGNDTDMIEKKWLQNLKDKNPKADFTWLNTELDNINIEAVAAYFASYNIFCDRKIVVVRNADSKQELSLDLAKALEQDYLGDNILVLLAGGLNQTTKLGKYAKQHFIVQEFSVPEIKPFAMLDSLNARDSLQTLQQLRKLLENDYNAMALHTLVFNHLLLLRKVKEYEGDSFDWIARQLKENPYRIKKMVVGTRYWTKANIEYALTAFSKLGKDLRTWPAEPNVLLEMALIDILR